jgi:hypothetical protein
MRCGGSTYLARPDDAYMSAKSTASFCSDAKAVTCTTLDVRQRSHVNRAFLSGLLKGVEAPPPQQCSSQIAAGAEPSKRTTLSEPLT